MRRALLADVDPLGVRGREVQQAFARQMIVEDGIGALQNLAAFDGDESGIARAGADQVDLHAVMTLRMSRAPAASMRSPECPCRARPGRRPGQLVAHHARAIGRRDDRASDAIADPSKCRVRADGHLAAAAKRREQRPLRRHRRVRRRMIQLARDLVRRAAIVASLDRQRALPDRRTHDVRLESARECDPPSPAAAIRPPPARSRRIALRRACAAACRRCRADSRSPGRGPARAAAPRAAANWCRLRSPRAARRAACPISASRGSSRSGIAASVRPAGSSVGMSFKLCTARSIAPASSASSISLVNSPLPPTCASGTSVILSPVVLMISSARFDAQLLQGTRQCAAPATARVATRAIR